MAGDWIKMRTDLYRDPKVCAIADELMDSDGELARYVSQNTQSDMSVTRNVMRNAAVGALLSVWGVMRIRGKRSGDDLVCRGVSLAVVDDIAELQGFGDAMRAVGWVYEQDGTLVFPRFFEEHNTDPAEAARQKNADRQRRFREKKQAEIRSVTDNVTVTHREEKRREEEKTMRKPAAVPPGFEQFWKVYPRRRNRGDAEKAWAKLKPDASLQAKILQAVEVAKARDDWRKDGGQFVPYPASWLNAKGWEDDVAGEASDLPSDPDAWRRDPLFAGVVVQ